MKVEVKITKVSPTSGRAVVRLGDEADGLTISNILVQIVQQKFKVTLPLSQQRHPVITLRGTWKQSVVSALKEACRQSFGPEHLAEKSQRYEFDA